MNLSGNYLSVAPQANLVIVRAFDGEGGGRYIDVISGLNWIVANSAKYNIRVINLSFGAPPESYYWNDPLNQAVMAAWQAGIVVVAAAGNEGPTPMTIDVPGNVPYVITTGALTDNYTPYNLTRRPPGLVLLHGSDLRGLRQARGDVAGRPHGRLDVEPAATWRTSTRARWPRPRNVHDVGHLDGGGRDHGRRRADAAVRIRR